jgi:Cof subfamily protein (haloacid dehalogenase superfamily)
MMPIKLLAADLDGTLVADLHTIPARTQATIKAVVEQDVRVVIATGRGYEDTRKFVHMLGLTTPVICYQGAIIYDFQTGQTIANEGLSMPATSQLIDLARSLDLSLSLHLNGNAYTERQTAQSRTFFDNIGTSLTEVADLKQVITTPPIKGMIVHPPHEIQAMAARLQTAVGDRLNVFHSLDILIEITSPNVSKGQALETLAVHYGLLQNEVMAIGDQDNDVEMIAWAGLGVAMGNASPKAKAAADHIAPPLEEEGAVWAIEKFILE